MADAKRCDICGNCYDRYKSSICRGGRYFSTDLIMLGFIDIDSLDEDFKLEDLEVCPICSARIRNFIDILKLDNESGDK